MYKYLAGSYGLKLTKGVATSSLRYFARNEKEMRACDVILQILILHSWLVNAATNQGSLALRSQKYVSLPHKLVGIQMKTCFSFCLNIIMIGILVRRNHVRQ